MRYYALDTETTVMKKDDMFIDEWDNLIMEGETKVWSVAFTPLSPDPQESDVIVQPNLSTFIGWCESQTEDCTFYIHNLKFDGTFFVFYMLANNWVFSTESIPKKLKPHQFICLRTDKGVYHNIKWKTMSGKIITLLDSLKIAPFPLKKLGEDYDTKFKKLEMDYTGKQDINAISIEDKQYILNDVLCLAEVVYRLRESGVNKNTTSATALAYYKETLQEEWEANHTETEDEIKQYCEEQNCKRSEYAYRKLFPHLKNCLVPVDYANDYYKKVCELTGVEFNQTMFAFQSYFGGWCYVNPKYKGKRLKGLLGESYDATSHYPSMMHSVTNHLYPYGEGEIRPIDPKTGLPVNFDKTKEVFIIQFQCEFKIKPRKFPSIQIKGDERYNGREWLTKSNGETVLTLTQPHYLGFLKRYNVYNFKPLISIVYKAKKGMFDNFIDKWIKIKEAHREFINGIKNVNYNMCLMQLAKNNLNGLYGKFTSKPASWVMIPKLTTSYKLNSDGTYPVDEKGKQVKEVIGVKLSFEKSRMLWNDEVEQYASVGCFVTAYARETTISLAENNYDYFIYADTDSNKFLIGGNPFPEDMIGGELGKWKKEGEFKDSLFLRAKTYMYDICEKWNKKDENKEYETVVTCAGLTKKGKQKLLNLDCKVFDEEGKQVIMTSKDPYDYFTYGLYIEDCKLSSKQISGGTRLVESDFSLKRNSLG